MSERASLKPNIGESRMTRLYDKFLRPTYAFVRKIGGSKETVMAGEDIKDGIKADLLGFALVPRPDRLAAPASEQLPAALRGEAAALAVDLASLSLEPGLA